MPKPELLVSVFSDYICPFCYVGSERLKRLRETYDLKVNWCFIEIHPETPVEGVPVSELGYAPEQWVQMMEGLKQLAEQEGVQLAGHARSVNSHKALLLAEAAKQAGAEGFYRLNDQLYRAYFSEERDISDEKVLRELAGQSGLPADLPDRAWSDPMYEKRLQQNLQAARQLGVTGTPTYFIAGHRMTGVVPLEDLQRAAERALLSPDSV